MLLEKFGDCFYMSADSSYMVYQLKSAQVTSEGYVIKEGSWVLSVAGIVQDSESCSDDLMKRNSLTVEP